MTGVFPVGLGGIVNADIVSDFFSSANFFFFLYKPFPPDSTLTPTQSPPPQEVNSKTHHPHAPAIEINAKRTAINLGFNQHRRLPPPALAINSYIDLMPCIKSRPFFPPPLPRPQSSGRHFSSSTLSSHGVDEFLSEIGQPAQSHKNIRS